MLIILVTSKNIMLLGKHRWHSVQCNRYRDVNIPQVFIGYLYVQTRLSDFTFTFHFHSLEKEMATHSSVLAWRIPGTAESGGLLSMGSRRVGHDWSDLEAAACSWHFLRPKNKAANKSDLHVHPHGVYILVRGVRQ